jgi:hypothetical protein
LLAAARSTLGDDVLPLLEGRAAFQLRVTLRALGMVGRELNLAEEHAAIHAAGLARLGVADEADFAGAIRDGQLLGRDAEIFEVLRASVRAKVEVANPSYLDERNASAKEGS